MSDSTEIKLSIFTPLDEYFQILCATCGTTDTASGCIDAKLVKLLTNECDSKSVTKDNTISKNFEEALKQFAINLKEADSPISKTTIKGTMFDIFRSGLSGSKDVNEAVKKINDLVANNSVCKGIFKMTDKVSTDSSKPDTYSTVLATVLSTDEFNKAITGDEPSIKALLNKWLQLSFDGIYADSTTWFKDSFLSEVNVAVAGNKQINRCHKQIMETYFQIMGVGDVTWKTFWGDAAPGNWGTVATKASDYATNHRLNIIIVKRGTAMEQTLKDKTSTEYNPNIAKISFAFPLQVRDKFNSYLVLPNEKVSGLKYSYAGTTCSAYKLPNAKGVLEFFKNEIISGRARPRPKGEPYVVDVVDDEPYTDSDVEKTPYKIGDLNKELVNYMDTWAADLNGNLYSRTKGSDGKYSKWEVYTDDKKEADAKLFMEKADETCGHLCIFNDASECNDFFQRMMQGDSYSMDELVKEINKGSFVQSYKKLKENIIKVNPIFVIGTLRMFQFQKHTKLNPDGRKTIKVETFTHWWSRLGSELMKLSTLGDKVYTGETGSTFPGVHKQTGLEPNPPANLELFFKLLISYINNNEFVINPQTKELINKLGTTSIRPTGTEDQPEFFEYYDESGKLIKVKNGAYQEYKKPDVESLSGLMKEMQRYSSLGYKPVDMGVAENRLNLSTLLGLMVGVTNGGHIRLSKSPAYSTGLGYITGGAPSLADMLSMKDSSELQKIIETLKPCSRNAVETFLNGVKAIERKGKRLDTNSEFYKNIVLKLNELIDSEETVFTNLKILAEYVKVIGALNDNTRDEKVVEQTMKDAIDEYNRTSIKLSRDTDSTTSLLIKSLYTDRASGPTEFYSPLV
jgi:hypothetical protein